MTQKQTAGHDRLGEFAPQFAGHGISQDEISEIITHLAFYCGWPKAWSAFGLAKEAYGADR